MRDAVSAESAVLAVLDAAGTMSFCLDANAQAVISGTRHWLACAGRLQREYDFNAKMTVGLDRTRARRGFRTVMHKRRCLQATLYQRSLAGCQIETSKSLVDRETRIVISIG